MRGVVARCSRIVPARQVSRCTRCLYVSVDAGEGGRDETCTKLPNDVETSACIMQSTRVKKGEIGAPWDGIRNDVT